MEKTTRRSNQGNASGAILVKPDVSKVKTSKTTKEYISFASGATHMLIQSGVTVYDEKSNSVREIRYCENENSIFKDEQSASSVKTPIVFRMGRIFVNPNQPNLDKYMSMHPGNRANGGSDFELVDNEAKAKVDVEAEFLVSDAVSMIKSKPWDELLMVATALDLDTDRPVMEIKHDLLSFAKSNPKVFISSFDDPMVAMKSKINRAASMQIIKLDQDAVRWFDSNKTIISVPVGQDPTEVMVRYCMTEKAVSLVEEIDRQLSL